MVGALLNVRVEKNLKKKNEKEKEKNMFKIRYTQPLFESSMVIKVNFLIYFDKNR